MRIPRPVKTNRIRIDDYFANWKLVSPDLPIYVKARNRTRRERLRIWWRSWEIQWK